MIVLQQTERERVLASLMLSPEERAHKNAALLALLDAWVKEGDEQEQRETFEFLKRALDEDRPSYRKLFS